RHPSRRRRDGAFERNLRHPARTAQPGATCRNRPYCRRARRRPATHGGAVEVNNGEPWWISLIKAALIVNLVMLAFAYTTWLERKLLGRMELRYGPNRAGRFGLLQEIAGLVQLLRTESFFPVAASDSMHIAEPVLSISSS